MFINTKTVNYMFENCNLNQKMYIDGFQNGSY